MRSNGHRRTSLTLLVSLAFLGTVVSTAQPANAVAPLNDDFDTATVIGSLPFSETLDASEATRANDDPGCLGGLDHTVWYSFTASSDTRIEVDTFGSSYDTTLSAYSGSRGSLVQLACNNDTQDVQSRIRVDVGSGQTVYLLAGSYPGILAGDLSFHVDVAPPPAPIATNDDFDDASVIGSLPFSQELDVSAATAAPDDPQCVRETSHTVWFAYTATQDVRISVSTEGSEEIADTILSAYSGARGSLTRLACNDDFLGFLSRVTVTLAPGATAFFMVGTSDAQPGSRLRLTVDIALPPPANDDFNDATQITSLPFTESIDASGATTADDDPMCAPGGDQHGPTIWYAFTASQDVRIRANTSGSDFAINLTAHIGTRGELVQVACDFGAPRGIRVDVGAGQTVYLLVDMAERLPGNTGNTLVMTVEVATPPPNDEIADAIEVSSVPFSHTVDLTDATRAVDDPSCATSEEPDGHTVWYSFSSETDVFIEASALNAPDSFTGDRTISAYQGTRGSLTQIACDGRGGFDNPRIGFLAPAGETIFIIVGVCCGSSGGPVTVELDVASPPPANDDVRDAKPVQELPFTEEVDSLLATRASDDPALGCGSFEVPPGSVPDHTVWYSVTADTLTRVQGRAFPTFDFTSTTASAYSVDNGVLSELACDTEYGAGVTVTVAPGQTVLFMFGMPPGIPGADLTISFEPIPPPPNDDIATAVPITQSSLLFRDNLDVGLATSGPRDPRCFGAGSTVWYAFTPAYDMLVEASTAQSRYDTVLAAFETRSGGPRRIACLNDNDPGSPDDGIPIHELLDIRALAGHTYLFMIGAIGEPSILRFSVKESVVVRVDRVGLVTKSGEATISGTVACSHALGDYFILNVEQHTGDQTVSTNLDKNKTCPGGVTRWSETVSGFDGTFHPGPVQVFVFWNFFEPSNLNDYGTTHAEATVRLVRQM